MTDKIGLDKCTEVVLPQAVEQAANVAKAFGRAWAIYANPLGAALKAGASALWEWANNR